VVPAVATAQVDQERARVYFTEAAALCEREGGRLWGVSLCGPMVFADASTKTMATNQPVPEGNRPTALGFANAAVDWGGVRWSTYVWQMIPANDEHARGRLMLHELFHRVQPQLGLLTPDGQNDHLDTLDGRYWLQLEWRALARALAATGAERPAAVRDALAFRATRRSLFPGAAEHERRDEIREGLAQYTGTVASVASAAEAAADTIDQLTRAPQSPSFVRTFAYASGTAYGILLDAWSPGWTRKVTATDDLGDLLMTAAGLRPSDDLTAADRHGGPSLRAAEEKRDAEHKARVAGLRRRFVDGPVLVLPNAGGSFTSLGVTALPGAGTVYPNVRVTAEWGHLEAASALRSSDRSRLILPAPAKVEGTALTGDGWTLTLAPGWLARPGPRAGDFEVVRER
jgi:hypothetical protein